MAGIVDGRSRGRVVLFPLPFQGHLSPMLQLADVLHGRGLAVTILHTIFNAPDPASHPEFVFIAVPDGMPDAVVASKDPIAKILAMNAAMEASGCVRDALASVVSEEPRPACLVIDTSLITVQKAAVQLGLRTIVLHTGSAACVRLFRSYPMLHEKGYLPAQEAGVPQVNPSNFIFNPIPDGEPTTDQDIIYIEVEDEVSEEPTTTTKSESIDYYFDYCGEDPEA